MLALIKTMILVMLALDKNVIVNQTGLPATNSDSLTLSITSFSITTLSIMTLRLMGLFIHATGGIKDTA